MTELKGRNKNPHIASTIVPQPHRFERRAGEWAPTSATRRLIDGETDAPDAAQGRVTADLRLRVIDGEQGRHDLYRLRIAEKGVEIEYATPNALRYALQTLRQLSALHRKALPACRIEDWADFPMRGFMLDVSRDRVPRLVTLEMIIDLLARLRINHLQLYTEHTFAYEGHEEVWRDASPYDAVDMRRVIAYSAARGIELVPNQNSYGHMERWLKHPAYRSLAECPDGFVDPFGVAHSEPSTLCPILPESEALIADLYRHYLPLFPGSQVNVGGDEPFEHCMGRSADHCRRLGAGRVYLDFILKLRALAAGHGKSIQIWGDIVVNYPELLEALPADLQLLEWGYEADHPFAEHGALFNRRGLNWVICPGTSSWLSLGGRWENARDNLRSAALAGMGHGATGYLITDWGDCGHLQQLSASLPGLFWGAALAWNGEAYSALQEGEVGALLSDWLSTHLFGDRLLADAQCLLAGIPARHDLQLPNASLPAILLIDQSYPYYRERYPHYRGYDWRPVQEDIAAAESLLLRAPDSIWRSEILLTCSLLRHACRLGAQMLDTPSQTIAEIGKAERQRLHSELAPCVEEYRRMWLVRSRPGGLRESVGHLERLLSCYTQRT